MQSELGGLRTAWTLGRHDLARAGPLAIRPIGLGARSATGHQIDTAARSAERRWLIAVPAVLIQVVLGLTLAWSVFRDPLIQGQGWTISQVTLAYTLNAFVSGLAACLGGLWLRRAEPRLVGLTGGALFGLGLALSSGAADRLWLLYLAYGVIGGLGRGLGSVVPPTILIKWFPNRSGLTSGLSGAGVGSGPVLAAPAASVLIASLGVLPTFLVLGAIALVVLVGMAWLLRNPPETPPAATPSGPALTPLPGLGYSVGQALRTRQFYGLWNLLFIDTVGGLALISQAIPLTEEQTGVDRSVAVGLLATISVACASGQLVCGWLSDLVGRRSVFLALLLLQATAFVLLPSTSASGPFAVLMVLVLFCAGGGPGTAPAFAADYFGTKDLGAIWGCLLTALGCAGALGPMLIALARESTGSYDGALYAIAALMAAGTLLPLLLRPPSLAAPSPAQPAPLLQQAA
jgi:OFA family oxalate/formate antiporter-like MFS transporter